MHILTINFMGYSPLMGMKGKKADFVKCFGPYFAHCHIHCSFLCVSFIVVTVILRRALYVSASAPSQIFRSDSSGE